MWVLTFEEAISGGPRGSLLLGPYPVEHASVDRNALWSTVARGYGFP